MEFVSVLADWWGLVALIVLFVIYMFRNKQALLWGGMLAVIVWGISWILGSGFIADLEADLRRLLGVANAYPFIAIGVIGVVFVVVLYLRDFLAIPPKMARVIKWVGILILLAAAAAAAFAGWSALQANGFSF